MRALRVLVLTPRIRRALLESAILVLLALVVGWVTVARDWGLEASLAAAVTTPILWLPLVGLRSRSSIIRGAVVGSVTGVLAQVLPSYLFDLFQGGLRTDPGDFGTLAMAMYRVASGGVALIAGLVIGALAGVRRPQAGSSKPAAC